MTDADLLVPDTGVTGFYVMCECGNWASVPSSHPVRDARCVYCSTNRHERRVMVKALTGTDKRMADLLGARAS